MNHKGTVRIETERLVLRRFRADDAAAAFRNWTGDDRVTAYLRWPTHGSLAVTEHVLAEWIAKYEDPGFYQWAIVPKAGADEPIGTISVVDRNERLDIVHIGYCIGSLWWNRGFTSEAFAAIIPFLFDDVGVHRIESQHDPANPHSGKVMAKCGLHYEGTLRRADFSNQGVVDAAMYSLLADEWRAGTLRRDTGEDPRLRELEEAKRALDSLLGKCRKVLLKLTPGRSQHTLMVRRIRAFEVSIELIEKERRAHGT
jgi:[ribosomal protein S5]-alanine N-acetyltransferase